MMESIKSLLQHKYAPYIIGGTAVLISVPIVKRMCFGRQHEQKKLDISKYPRDKVILFQFPRGSRAPSHSPFTLKLETYLRMANIPYQNVHGFTSSSKKKNPFIVYDGEEVADSHFCIQHLNRVRGVDLNSWMTDDQKALTRAFRVMMEDHLFWVYVMLFVFDYGFEESDSRVLSGKPVTSLQGVGRKMHINAYGHGMARHTKEEILSLGEGDIRALSTFLGKKAFLSGDQPCEEDCSVFALLAQFYWHVRDSPLERLVKGECRNLGDYCERMKDRFWPDWDECITHGDTKEATK